MFNKLKKAFYFKVALYFRFFAKIQLWLWKPRIIVITGSNNKTTLLHLVESQLGDQAIYSHLANSTYGIPFHILGLKRRTLLIWEWPFLFLAAPFAAFKTPPKKKLYIVEADCDRPHEGKFLASLLKPEVTLWANSSNSHAVNFPNPVSDNIAYEFGYFLENTKKLCIINGDSTLINSQLRRVSCKVEKITKRGHLQDYKLEKKGTTYKIDGGLYRFNFLLPEDSFYSVNFTLSLLNYLDIKPDVSFKKFSMPPGRSSVFPGIKDITIIDSSYNATPSSMRVILQMFEKYTASNKWLVLGDMIELGSEEETEHQNLATLVNKIKAKQIILVGPRLASHTFPKLIAKNIKKFDGPKEALEYIKDNISGEETILFKGARFLEGIIEHLLANQEDVAKLCRREKVWVERRKRWGV